MRTRARLSCASCTVQYGDLHDDSILKVTFSAHGRALGILVLRLLGWAAQVSLPCSAAFVGVVRFFRDLQ